MSIERGGGGNDDEKGGKVRKAHADQGIGADALEFRTGAARSDAQRFGVATVLFFHFLAGLPEEQVGADRGAKYGDQRHRMFTVKRERGDDDAAQGRIPINARDKDYGNVGKQRQRGPFEDAGIAGVADQDFGQYADNAKGDGEGQHRAGDQKT